MFKILISLCKIYLLSDIFFNKNKIGFENIIVDVKSKPLLFQKLLDISEYLNSIPVGKSK